MNATFYKNFVKKYNSTKRPTGTGYSHTVRMKKECSVSKPTFLIDGVELDYNYCVFNNRYYFITDILLNNDNIYEISCDIDVLATYRPQISSYNAFVERSGSTYDAYMGDKAISISGDVANMQETLTDVFSASGMLNQTGYFVFPCMNEDGVEIYLTQHLEDFGELFMPATYGLSSFSVFGSNGMAGLMNTSQYFGKVIWIPFGTPALLWGADGIEELHASVDACKVGYLSFKNHQGMFKVVNKTYLYEEPRKAILKPNLFYGDFRDMDSKWSEYNMFLPAVGEISMDSSVVGNPDITITVKTYFNPVTGEIKYKVAGVEGFGSLQEKSIVLGTYNGNLSYTIPWGDNQWGVKDFYTGILNTPNQIASGWSQGSGIGAGMGEGGNLIGGAIGSYMKGLTHLQTTALDLIGSVRGSVSGGQGSLANAKTDLQFRLTAKQFASGDVPNVVAGRPLFKNRQISGLNGYIECGNASLDIAGFEDEKKILNNFLNNGFYYE